MSKEIIREGDKNNAKGFVKKGTGCQSVLVNGKPVGMKNKSQVKVHPAGKVKHPVNPIAKGDVNILVDGNPVAFVGVPDKCKHNMIKSASADVLVEGKMG